MTTKFTGYRCPIHTDPVYYGSECTPERALQCAEKLETMIAERFPGIELYREPNIVSRAGVSGPDDETCEDIARWIEDRYFIACEA